MADALRYNGKTLGWIHSYTGDRINKFNLTFEGIDGLEQMCRLADEELLEIDGMQALNYREFREVILSRTKRIYLSVHEYNLDFHWSEPYCETAPPVNCPKP